jgi:hypothetical protein
VAGHPLRSATHRSLGEPLPHQLANGTQDHLRVVACEQRPPLTAKPCDFAVSFGISTPLGVLSPSRRQVSYALLTRSPLYSGYCYPFRVRLACLIHAANVRSEPGSNSPLYMSHLSRHLHRNRRSCLRSLEPKTRRSETKRDPLGLHNTNVRYSIFKEQTRDLREFGRFWAEPRTYRGQSVRVKENFVGLRAVAHPT